MKKSIIILLLVVAGAALFTMTMGMFSLIDGAEQPSCVMDATNGKTCTIDVFLPQDRAFSSYSLDLLIDKVPEDNFGEFKSATQVAKSALLREEDEDREEDEWETIFMYDIPEAEDVYQFQVQAEATASIVLDGTNDARAIIKSQVISTDYKPNGIVSCSRDRRSDCVDMYGENQFMVQSWRDDGEYDYTIREDTNLRDVTIGSLYGDLSADDVRIDNAPNPSTIISLGTTEGLTNSFRTDKFLISTVYEREERAKGTISAPMNVQYAVKKLITPMDLSYSVGGVTYETMSGEVFGEVETLDIAAQLNDYCGRDDGEIDECLITLTFKTTTAGKVTLSENEVLKIALEKLPVNYDECVLKGGAVPTSLGVPICSYKGQSFTLVVENYEECILYGGEEKFLNKCVIQSNEFKDSEGNLISGFSTFAGDSFDFENNPTQAYIVSGSILALILGFIMFGGKKK